MFVAVVKLRVRRRCAAHARSQQPVGGGVRLLPISGCGTFASEVFRYL